MQVVVKWTGRKADLLREALRMTLDGFADELRLNPRTIAYWRSRPATIPQQPQQDVLDRALLHASERAQACFALLLEAEGCGEERMSIRKSTGLTSDEAARVDGVIHGPARLDAATVANLSMALAGQRRAEDSLGPAVLKGPMTAELNFLENLLRGESGPHRKALMHLVAEWMTFVGWLNTALRRDQEADQLFAKAEELADELGDGVLAATATSYRGYLARLQGRHRATVRLSAAALAAPGAHPTQRTYDLLQTAQAYADLGDVKEAQNFLLRASDLAGSAGEPPSSVYWYTEPFFRLNIGVAQLGIGQYRDAADSISSGIADLPIGQQNAGWLNEYRQALDYAVAQIDMP